MAFNLGDVFVTLKVKGDDLKRGLDAADKQVSSIGGSMKKSFQAAEAGSAALLGTLTVLSGAAVIFGKKSVDAYFAAQEAQTKLRTNLLNVKGATDAHVDSLSRLASQLQSVGVIEDDVIKAGMSQLATFNLQGKTIEKLTPKITDMVAQLKGHNATAEDMVGINNLVGKVMTGNVGALSRYGVTLSETQAEMIKNGTETERAAMLVEVLGQNYGKVNEELRKTPQGRITALKNSFGDLQEGVGEFIVTAIGPVIDGFAGWVSKMEEAGGILEYFKQLIKDNQDILIPLAGAIMLALVPALVAMAAGVWGVLAPLLPFLAAGALLGIVAKKMADKLGGWGKLWDAIKPKLEGAKDALLGVYNIIMLLITGDFKGVIFGMSEDSTFVDWLFRIRDGFFQFWEILKGVGLWIAETFMVIWGGLQKVFEFLWPSIKSLGETFINDLLPALKQIWDAVVRLWNALNPALTDALKVIGAIIGVVVIAAIWLLINGLKVVIAVFSGVVSAISNVINWIANLVQWYGNLWGMAINVVKGILDWFGKIPGKIGDVIGGIVEWFKSLPGKIGNVMGGVGDAVSGPFKSAFNAIARFWNSTVGKLSFKAPDWVPGIGGKGFDMPKLPELALGTPNFRGGLVGRINEFGPETAVLPKGTRVLTAEQTRQGEQGGNTYHIHLDGVMARSESELADIIEGGIQALDRRLAGAGKKPILGGA